MSPPEGPFDVLIVGAGPTGMVLAMSLVLQGITNIRIIDKSAGVANTSRAAGVQSRTLEIYRQLGIVDQIIAQGEPAPAINYWTRRRLVARSSFHDAGKSITPYNFLLSIPQDVHERILEARCKELGIQIEHNVSFHSFVDEGDHITARYTTTSGSRTCAAAYIVGADGAHSPVRHQLGISFKGRAYKSGFFVADVEAHGSYFDGEAHVAMDGQDFLAVFPFPGSKRGRIIGVVDHDESASRGKSRRQSPDDMTFEDLRPQIEARLDNLVVEKVIWFATYRAHHRMASSFHAGRAFLIGDAGHIHSPVGGQGMNTGIGDAANLSWKLVHALRAQKPHRSGRSSSLTAFAPDEDGHRPNTQLLFESFRSEREGFARTLLKTTDRIFNVCVDMDWRSRLFRFWILPIIVRCVNLFPFARKTWFMGVSQTGIAYRDSALSQGYAGSIHGGDRVPWVHSGSFDNMTVQSTIEWSVHVYGQANADLEAYCVQAGLRLHSLPWSEAAGAAGYQRDAAYLVRPDLYVACADPKADPRTLMDYFESRGICIDGS